MRRAARRGVPMRSGALDQLNEMLLGGVGSLAGEIVIVPPPSLMSVPWAAMPSLAGRAISVCPSAELWARAAEMMAEKGRITIAGGPDLAIAESEVEAVAGVYEEADLHRPGASVEEVRSSLEGTAVAHIACHATFQYENPMFSSLRLGDGDLNVYDIERLKQPPSLVVLSACDSGYTEARAGSELAGLTSALLSMGTRNVVASVGLVPDSPATSDLMVDFHRGLVGGLEPAKALAAAQEKAFDDPERFVSAASFICVGA
ncbi:MAG TPA: CHAT domain-containing protein, partial [Acidimicrobiia bacterium]